MANDVAGRSIARCRQARLDSAQQRFQARAEALVAIAVPGVKSAGWQGREAVGRQGTEKRVQLLPGGGIAQALLGGGRGIGEGEAEGVVVEATEGQGGFAAGRPGRGPVT